MSDDLRAAIDAAETKQPLYDFYIDENGVLFVRKYTDYTVKLLTHCCNKQQTQFWIHRPGTIMIKTEDQLDKCIHGHIVTFELDTNKARNAFIEYYGKKAERAEQDMRRFNSIKNGLMQNQNEPAVGV